MRISRGDLHKKRLEEEDYGVGVGGLPLQCCPSSVLREEKSSVSILPPKHILLLFSLTLQAHHTVG